MLFSMFRKMLSLPCGTLEPHYYKIIKSDWSLPLYLSLCDSVLCASALQSKATISSLDLLTTFSSKHLKSKRLVVDPYLIVLE